MEGWISIHRKICDTDLWLCEPFSRGQAWVDLIMLANHKDGFIYVRGNKVDIKRGQVGWSEKRLSQRWQWSRTKVRKFLNDLEKEQQIKQQKTFITTVVSIVNYDKYQDKRQQKDSRKTAERQQKDTNNNDNNDINENNILFDDFWNAYDKKVGRKKCEAIWGRLSNETRVLIMQHIPKYKKARPDAQFRKDPATYLNNESWNDEIITKNGTHKSSFDEYRLQGIDLFQ